MGTTGSKSDTHSAGAKTLVETSRDHLVSAGWQHVLRISQSTEPVADPSYPSAVQQLLPFLWQLSTECSSAYAGRVSCDVALFRADAAAVASAASTAGELLAVPAAVCELSDNVTVRGEAISVDALSTYLIGNVLYGEGMRDAPPAFEAPEFLDNMLGGRNFIQRIVVDFIPTSPFSVAFLWTRPSLDDVDHVWSVVLTGFRH